MKNKHDTNNKGRQPTLRLLAVLLALLLLLTGCTKTDEMPSEASSSDVTAYRTRIEELENELAELKEQYYIATMKPTQGSSSSNENAEGNVPPESQNAGFGYRIENGAAYVTSFSGSAGMVTLPETVENIPLRGIEDRAFEGAPVMAITLPAGMVRIGWFAFYGCESLVEIYIPAEVCEIGYGAFDGCGALRIVTPADSYAAKYAKSYGIPCTEQ